MADDPQNQSLPLQIRVLEGPLSKQVLQDGETAGIIKLVGRALPNSEFTIEGDQKVQTTWYDGNPVATQQVSGPREMPTTLSGVWKDRYLGGGNGAARRLARLFVDIRRRGPQLEVSWGAGALPDDGGQTALVGDPFTMRGILKHTKFSLPFPQWVRWEMVFEWRGTEELTSGPVTATSVLNPREGLNNTQGLLDKVGSMVEAFGDLTNNRLFAGQARYLSDVQRALDTVESASRGLQSASAAISAVAALPITIAGSVVASAAAGVDGMAAVIAALEGYPWARAVSTDSALAYFQMRQDVLAILGEAWTAKEQATVASDTMSRQAQPEVIAVVQAPAGTDLREIATQHYGTPDGWIAIADFNDFPTSSVPMPPSGPSDQKYLPVRVPRLLAGATGGC